MALDTPFDYAAILNGTEIIFRGLKQQHIYADANEYGLKWDKKVDGALQTQTEDGSKSMREQDFKVPQNLQGCVSNPPCPWDKSGADQLTSDNFMPIIMPNVSGTTYNIKVSKQTASAGEKYKADGTLADYKIEPGALVPGIQSKFLYYSYAGKIKYLGEAIIVIEEIQGGSIQNTFTYLFKFV
ncbi:MAG: hypothetical protein DRI69_08350 [Bacteroidetes bacterium]|nr:MAG: hypothetical protein DRI69_08350 [Bacteroidota bacterium]